MVGGSFSIASTTSLSGTSCQPASSAILACNSAVSESVAPSATVLPGAGASIGGITAMRRNRMVLIERTDVHLDIGIFPDHRNPGRRAGGA